MQEQSSEGKTWGKLTDLVRDLKRRSHPRAGIFCTIFVILDGSVLVSPSEHLSPEPRKPRTETPICEATKRRSLSYSLAFYTYGYVKAGNIHSGVFLLHFWWLFSGLLWKGCYGFSSHWCKQDSQALWMKASASWCTVCLGLLERKITKSWKVSFLEGVAFIWQQQQNVLLFYTSVGYCFFLFLKTLSLCKNLLNRETYPLKNHLSVLRTFFSISVFSLQVLILSPCEFLQILEQLFCLLSLQKEIFLFTSCMEIIETTAVKAGDI